MRIRVSLMTEWPTASIIRLTWCFLPSWIVTSSQELLSALLTFVTFAGAVNPSSSLTPRSRASILASSSTPLTLIR